MAGFTGRTAELRKLNDLVTAAQTTGESGVIVLSGGPGVGKSALAVHLGHTLARRFPDGQLHLDLHGFAHAARPMSPAAALRHLLAALGAARTGSDDAEQQSALYRSLTARRRLFILLDNARSVEQVRPLLPGGSSSVIVVTSRYSLAGLAVRDGARRVTLDVMQEEEAISLFSRIVGQPFTAREYPVVRNVVAACARLPLALRIAAARINSAPSPKVAMAEFTECNLFGNLDVPGDEETSLRSVFDWSYRALPADAAQLFRALGTGAGAELTLQDAAELIEAGPRLVRHAMNTLVDANLVHEPLPDHFRMNTLVFAYARQLDSVGHFF
ncbi:ATP-binding protein [Dactylosporangium sp. NBC_01737]|uniref:ATP-binding protein n=1 Tax=Dactylosporangium sp. NBC_01737 TaxID=2975959 RepID=UPI002E0E8D50|nr:ATP-binding protein [Dactylosporangium sp. NBC_01737]